MRISARRSRRTLITTGLNFDLAPRAFDVTVGASQFMALLANGWSPFVKGACNGAAHQQRTCDDTAKTWFQYITSKAT